MPEPENPEEIDPKEEKLKKIEEIIKAMSGGTRPESEEDELLDLDPDEWDEEAREKFLTQTLGPKKQYSCEEWVDLCADIRAGLDGLDKNRVRAVYHRCDEKGWIVRTKLISTGFDFAILDGIEPQKALEMFEKTEDLEKLKSNYYTFKHLTKLMPEPFCTLSELADLTNEFIEFQKKHRENTIETGFPNRIFRKSTWFDWHLGRLYYVKSPVNQEHIFLKPDEPSAFYKCNPDPWKGEETEYFSIWAKEIVEVTKTDLEQVTTCVKPPFAFLLSLCKIEDNKFINCDGKVVGEKCPYSEAPYFDFLSPDKLSRLDSIREKVFDIRLDILTRIQRALQSEKPQDFWEDCLSILKNLDYEEVQFLLFSDHVFLGVIDKIKEGHPYKWLCDFNRNAGLNEIIHTIGHIEKELTIGTVHKTRSLLKPIIEDEKITSYFQVVKTPLQDRVDKALEGFDSLRESDKEFSTDFYKKVNRALNEEFETEVVTRKRVKRKNKSNFESLVGTYAENKAAELEILNQGTNQQTISMVFEIGAFDFIFSKCGKKWLIRYDKGNPFFVDNLKGIHHIAELLKNPHKKINAVQLNNLYYKTTAQPSNLKRGQLTRNELKGMNVESGIPVITPKEIHLKRKLISEKEKEIEDAKNQRKQEKVNELRDEMEFLKEELKRDVGLFNKSRKTSDPAKEAYDSVKKCINIALKNILKENPHCGTYLKNTIHFSAGFIYKPEKKIFWKI